MVVINEKDKKGHSNIQYKKVQQAVFEVY